MEEEIKIEPSNELAYWVGLTQADGSLKRFVYTDKFGKSEERVSVELSVKYLDLVKKFKEISQKVFERGSGPFLLSSGMWIYKLGAKTLLPIFKSMDIDFKDPPKPPFWCVKSLKLFGAYLAGIVDGDGDIRIKRKKYPQCVIRITSGSPQYELVKSIKSLLKCGIVITRRSRRVYFKKLGYFIGGKYCTLEFLVSSKTREFVRKFMIPYLTLMRKRYRLLSYIQS